MKKILKIAILTIAIISTAVFTPWDILRVWVSPVPGTVQEIADKATDYGLDGVMVYIDKKGSDPGLYAAGWKNRSGRIPADPQALFKIASISKLYMAAAAAKLISDKSLLPDKTLAEYLPHLAGKIENADQITLRMMLKHRSGIPDFIDHPAMPWADLPANPDDFLKLILNQPADFKPDSRYRYSNTNYLLVGAILNKTLGYSHHHYIKTALLEPLHLTRTYGVLSEADTSAMASGYFSGYDGDLKMQNYVCPGGSMVSTAREVGVFLRALTGGSLLSREEQAIYSSIYEYGHTGLLPGYSSIARYHKEKDAVVVMLVSTSGGNSWTKMEIMYKRIVKRL